MDQRSGYEEARNPAIIVYCGHDLKIKIKVNEHMKRVGVSVYFKKMYILEKGYLYPKSKLGDSLYGN